ncbi:MAG: allophycocyanin [Hydrococcus sp. C42_A2020_068]|uniref:allophycocyanin subunit alpha-B n=1 Tax=Pleurocapsa sp. PCC 7327 TaxID=118163 RepID=UPI00029FC417|nr:allophycocyanin subunit alpha-B [Pleurocapsa sp. PCC 7327]AFY77241.1 Phycobilisome protein [Pleurocapsa sp. PCC 7327]MBF2022683.1 allophycocyanin [Hydrococcus sp. C42_A2020_068]
MSIVKQVILNADEELRYPTPGELRLFQNFCQSGEKRIRIANKLAANEKRLVERGSARFWRRCPVTPSNSGNMRKTASCQRDQGWYIRLIAYCVLAGNEQPLAEIGTIGMKEMYQSLGIPIFNWVEALKCLKEEAIALLGEEDAAEVTPYFDHIIQTLALPGPPYYMNDK